MAVYAGPLTRGLCSGVTLALGLTLLTSFHPVPLSTLSWLLLSVCVSLLLLVVYLSFCPYHLDQTLTWKEKSEAARDNHAYRHLPPFPNTWYHIAHSKQLPPGQVQAISAVNTELVLYRPAFSSSSSSSSSSPAVVLDAYCPHLGAHLGYGGRVVSDCLVCPFHGWTFSQTGKCTNIPYAEKVPDMAKTTAWKTQEWNQQIYVWYDVDHQLANHHPTAEHILTETLLHYPDCRLVAQIHKQIGGHVQTLWQKILGCLSQTDSSTPTLTHKTYDLFHGLVHIHKDLVVDWKVDPDHPYTADISYRLSIECLGKVWYQVHVQHTLQGPANSTVSFYTQAPTEREQNDNTDQHQATCNNSIASSRQRGPPQHVCFLSITPHTAFIQNCTLSFYTLSSSLLFFFSPVFSRLLSHIYLHMWMRDVQQPLPETVSPSLSTWFQQFHSANGTRKRQGLDW